MTLWIFSGVLKILGISHCVKSVSIQSYFPAFGVNMERYFVSPYSVRMRGNTDHNNSEYGHLLCSAYLLKVKFKNYFTWVKMKCHR